EGDLPGEVVGELDEQLVLGRRSALAADLNDAADLVFLIDESADAALGGLALAPLDRQALVLLLEPLNGLLHVAAAFSESGLALAKRGVGLVAEFLHIAGRNVHLARSLSFVGLALPLLALRARSLSLFSDSGRGLRVRGAVALRRPRLGQMLLIGRQRG